MPSESQIRANRENAQLSTGPSSDAGKFTSSKNSTKSGVFADPCNLLPGEDRDTLDFIIRSYFKHIQPEGPVEAGHLETAIRSIWLVYRFDRLEPTLIDAEVAKSGKSPDLVYVELLSSPRNNTLRYLIQKRNQAQTAWSKAMKEIERLQKARGKQFNVPQPDHDEIGFVPPLALSLPESPDPQAALVPDIGS